MARISILGGGSWGIALAVLLKGNGHEVTIWSAVPSEIEALRNNRELKTLPGVRLDESIVITDDDNEAVCNMDVVIMAVASSYTRMTARRFSNIIRMNQIIVDVAKGVEDGTFMTLSEIISEEIPQADVAVLSGPSHAEEVGFGLPTTVVACASTRKTAEYLQKIFMNDCFRVYTSPDIRGVELGGALKNVVALAAGIADGLGYGDNAKAALITRGIKEITDLGLAMGGMAETFSGLTGIGDLIVTCASMHSRNRKAGILIGQGMSADEAMKKVGMVVEGVYSAKAAIGLSKKYNVPLPIIEQVNLVLFDGKDARTAVNELMLRDRKSEIPDCEW